MHAFFVIWKTKKILEKGGGGGKGGCWDFVIGEDVGQMSSRELI